MTDNTQVANGTLAGRLDFSGNDVRSLNDINGTLEATLQQTQALQLPVLQQLTPYVMPNQSSATTFNSGEVRARFGRGVVRFERFALVSSLAQLFIEGTVTLQGRLNLDVTANTGRLGINPAAPLVRLRVLSSLLGGEVLPQILFLALHGLLRFDY